MINKLRFYRKVAIVMLVIMAGEWIAPSAAYALTDGPTQPETHAFEPVGTTEMVDPFSGDFVYNIPLFDLPGPNGSYPFNMSYHSGASMDEEASWVGLGFSLNPGAIDRNLRGTADDANGDLVRSTMDIKNNCTYGVGMFGSFAPEIWTADLSKGTLNMSMSFNLYYNTYKGVGYNMNTGVSMSVSSSNTTSSGSFGVNLSLDSEEGPGVSPNISLSVGLGQKNSKSRGSLGGSFDVGFSSRRGLTNMSFSMNIPTASSKGKTATRKGTDSKDADYNVKIGGASSSARYNSSSISFAASGCSPSIDMPMESKNVNFSFGGGFSPVGIMLKGGVTGFYTEDKLKYKNEEKSWPSYGYMYLQNGSAAEGEGKRPLLDFDREKDGLVYENSPNMAVPVMNQDIYTVQGQGVGGMFRAYRNDIGVLFDQNTKSVTNGGGFGFEVGFSPNPPPTAVSDLHVSVEASYNHAENISRRWDNNGDLEEAGRNAFIGEYDFTDWDVDTPLYEPVFFKRPGEMVSQPTDEIEKRIGGDKAMKLKLDNNFGITKVFRNSAMVEKNQDDPHKVENNYDRKIALQNERRPRNMGILPLKNSYINSCDALGEYKIQYIDESGSSAELNRSTRCSVTHNNGDHSIENHTGAFTTTNTNGIRYVYALPVYNNVQVEQTFSSVSPSGCTPRVNIPDVVDGDDNNIHKWTNAQTSDQYRNRTISPPYAHSYLLTSVLGADYVDLTNNGPTEDDLGYWVKFTYKKVNRAYKWKAPYFDANYSRGLISTNSDDKASYVYGEKEVYYLAQAETKTHKAVFTIGDRKDAREAKDEFINNFPASESNIGEAAYKRLEKIELYSKLDTEEEMPIKVVHFEYDYSRCGNIDNNKGTGTDNAGKGKLTLKKLWFTYQKSTRGALNAYRFDYSEFNPNYSTFSVDRWGAYKPMLNADGLPVGTADNCVSNNLPYTYQGRDVNGDNIVNNDDKLERDKWASAWQLKTIHLPSGGEINVEYEQDDYAYVQNKRAMNMFNITRMGTNDPGEDSDGDNFCRIYADGQGRNYASSDKRIYFKLKAPIAATDVEKIQKIGEYFEGIDQLYYRILMRLREPSCSRFEEYITGYGSLESYGLADAVGDYHEEGYFILKPEERDGKVLGEYHPFTFNALQFLRSNLPQFTGTMECEGASPLSETGASASSNDAAANNAQVLFGMLDNVKELFSNFYKYHTGCNSSDPACNPNAGVRNWCSNIDVSKSIIRLNTPDKVKFGGGARVKSVKIKDNWSAASTESDSEYGQVFEYTITENGRTISSGVANYEPILGGEENPFKTVKKFPGRVPCKLDNNLMFEYPINESYFPAASVGYSQVTVKSINTDKILKDDENAGYSTSGVTVHQFFTSKEFPVITDETNLLKAAPEKWMSSLEDFYKFHLWIPLITLGQINIDRLAFSQGYSIELNDMHGKLKQVANYEITATGEMSEKPISWVKYNYKFEEVTKDGKTFKKLVNDIPVLVSDMDPGDHTKAEIQPRTVGLDYEMFTDMRYNMSYSANGGISVNVEIPFSMPTPAVVVWAPIPVPVPWPNLGYTDKMVKIAVTNKVINRTGILESIEAFDGGSVVTTKNWYWDAVTGEALLTSVTNDFDQPIFTYKYPAHWKYDGAGPAYKNLGLKFNADITIDDDCENGPYRYTFSYGSTKGAEFLVKGDEIVGAGQKLYVTDINSEGLVTVEGISKNEGAITDGSYDFYLVRSGRRNLLESKIAEIVALKDPTKDRTEHECNKILYPTSEDIPCEDFVSDFVQNILQYNAGHPTAITPITVGNPFGFIAYSVSSAGIISFYQDGPGKVCKYQFFKENGVALSVWELNRKLQVVTDEEDCPAPPSSVSIEGSTAINTSLTFKSDILWSDMGIVERCVYLFRVGDCDCNNDGNAAPITVESKTYSIEDVISASAVTLKDEWPLDYNDLRFTSGSAVNIIDQLKKSSGYATGTKGIWRPHETYTYFTDRSQSTGLDLKKDGTYNLTLFDWYNPFFGECDANWVKSNEITKYNPYTYETENKDVLGIYSSALYSYNGSMPIAVAANAKEEEIGFEGFEEYGSGELVDQYSNATGNIKIITEINNSYPPMPGCTTTVVEEYTGVGIFGDDFIFLPPNINTEHLVTTPRAQVEVTIDKVSVDGNIFDLPDVTYSPFTIESHHPNNAVGGHTIILSGPVASSLPAVWIGKVRITKTIPAITIPGGSGDPEPVPDLAYTDVKAHTGSKSLIVANKVSCMQDNLNLVVGKEYVISMWVSRLEYKNIYDYSVGNDIGINVEYYDPGATSPSSITSISPKGEIINGWQRIESTFVMPESADRFALKFKAGKVGGVTTPAYFDDIRIYPNEGEMKTYVYDPMNYRLAAELDNNNYGTLYYYNEEGTLFMVKRETAKGIMTVKENRQNIKNQNP